MSVCSHVRRDVCAVAFEILQSLVSHDTHPKEIVVHEYMHHHMAKVEIELMYCDHLQNV